MCVWRPNAGHKGQHSQIRKLSVCQAQEKDVTEHWVWLSTPLMYSRFQTAHSAMTHCSPPRKNFLWAWLKLNVHWKRNSSRACVFSMGLLSVRFLMSEWVWEVSIKTGCFCGSFGIYFALTVMSSTHNPFKVNKRISSVSSHRHHISQTKLWKLCIQVHLNLYSPWSTV